MACWHNIYERIPVRTKSSNLHTDLKIWTSVKSQFMYFAQERKLQGGNLCSARAVSPASVNYSVPEILVYGMLHIMDRAIPK